MTGGRKGQGVGRGIRVLRATGHGKVWGGERKEGKKERTERGYREVMGSGCEL